MPVRRSKTIHRSRGRRCRTELGPPSLWRASLPILRRPTRSACVPMLSLHTPRDAIALSPLKHGGRTPGAAKFLQDGDHQSSMVQRTIETISGVCDLQRRKPLQNSEFEMFMPSLLQHRNYSPSSGLRASFSRNFAILLANRSETGRWRYITPPVSKQNPEAEPV